MADIGEGSTPLPYPYRVDSSLERPGFGVRHIDSGRGLVVAAVLNA